jgi:hypothetical protein
MALLLESLDLALYHVDVLRDFYAPRTHARAIEMVLAGPDTVRIVQNIEARPNPLVPAVEYESSRLNNCRRSNEVGILLGNYRA